LCSMCTHALNSSALPCVRFHRAKLNMGSVPKTAVNAASCAAATPPRPRRRRKRNGTGTPQHTKSSGHDAKRGEPQNKCRAVDSKAGGAKLRGPPQKLRRGDRQDADAASAGHQQTHAHGGRKQRGRKRKTEKAPMWHRGKQAEKETQTKRVHQARKCHM